MQPSTNDSGHWSNFCPNCENSSKPPASSPKTVLVFGVFDLLHPGHVYFLKSAKSHGDRLVVVATRDERAEQEKGRRPINSLSVRLTALENLSCVDQALSGDEVGQWTMIQRINPDIICVGHDQDSRQPKIIAQLNGLQKIPKIIKLSAFQREQYSTTRLRQQLYNDGL
ncbi:MAG: adenylyltransferase/cytidyltransferase family protein [Patescibacteria group bacterium]